MIANICVSINVLWAGLTKSSTLILSSMKKKAAIFRMTQWNGAGGYVGVNGDYHCENSQNWPEVIYRPTKTGGKRQWWTSQTQHSDL